MKMKYRILVALLSALAVLALVVITVIMVYLNKKSFGDTSLQIEGTVLEHNSAGNSLVITSWNLGYAGLGAEADFFADGGSRLGPVSKEYTLSHIEAFKTYVKANEQNADLFLFQESAKKSSYIFNTSPFDELTSVLNGFYRVYSPAMEIKWFPVIGSMHIGNSVFSKIKPSSANRHALPIEKSISGILNPRYNFLESRYSISGSDKEWVIVNLHLSAFDKGGLIRQQQMEVLFDFVTAEYKKGNYVVVGGDWNHRLTESNFKNTTEEKYLFWIYDFPVELLPEGWQLSFDPSEPTVRTNERAYIDGENYTCIIDGFLCSPNVVVDYVRTDNLKFQHSDHNPVTIKVSIKE